MEQNKDTRVIYFSDLFFSVLYAWRKILIVALVFALLLGGVQTVRYMKARNTEPAPFSAETLQDIAELEEKLATNQLRITSLEDYMQDSIIMNMNPYQVYQATANIYVEAETPEIAIAVITAYQSYLTGNLAVSNDALLSEVNTAYLKELVSYEIVTAAGNMLTITVSYSDNEGVQQLMSALLAVANDATAYIQQEIAPHSVSILSSPTILRTSQNLEKRQSDYATSLATLKTEQETLEQDLKKLNATSAPQLPRNPLLMAAAGAVVGAFIVICLVFVRHIASDKVYSARTLKNRIGLRVLGRMSVSKRCKIDRFICKMEKRVCEPALAATAANIRNYCSGTQHMLVAGNDAQQAEAVMRLIREQTGMTVTCCGSLLQDVNALQALPACDTVLLVETCHKSTYSDIEASIQLVEDQGKALIGCMLIGG